jgi:putative hydrolase of the HAD superfamily
MPPSHTPSGRIRAIIFDMDNTLFDFVAAKQHACREVAGFLGRDDGEALFSCFINSPHGFESHENIRDYFEFCGLLQECDTRKLSGTCSFSGEERSPRQDPGTPGGGRIDLPCGTPFTWEVRTTEPGREGKDSMPGGASVPPAGVRDNLLADKSLYCNEVFARCCEIYEAEKIRVLSPYPCARETLAELKRRGLPLAIVTDAHNGNAFARLRKVGLDGFFDHVISYDMTGAKKPAPDAFLLALKKLGTLPSETLLVGDSIRRDIAPAKELGMITAYAKYGDRNITSRDPPGCRPDYVLGDIRELMDLVE